MVLMPETVGCTQIPAPCFGGAMFSNGTACKIVVDGFALAEDDCILLREKVPFGSWIRSSYRSQYIGEI